MPRRDHTQRLFVALYPPPESAQAMLAELRRLDLPEHRETPRAQIHLTLQFIGDTSERELDSVIESVDRSCAGIERFDLTPIRLIGLPVKGEPRLIALTTDAPPSLLELHARLARRLARNLRTRPSDRFLPHLTLCRFRGGVGAMALDHSLRLDPLPVGEVLLMRGVLRPGGAEHERIEAFRLG